MVDSILKNIFEMKDRPLRWEFKFGKMYGNFRVWRGMYFWQNMKYKKLLGTVKNFPLYLDIGTFQVFHSHERWELKFELFMEIPCLVCNFDKIKRSGLLCHNVFQYQVSSSKQTNLIKCHWLKGNLNFQ